MTSRRIAIIGAGNMGSALIAGLINNGYEASELWVSDTDLEKLATLKQRFAINTTQDNKEAVNHADVVVFAIKPQVLLQVVHTLLDQLQKHKPLVISIAAGVREFSIRHILGEAHAVVRAMPNIPALIGCGATALYANHHVTSHERSEAEKLMRALGVVVWIQDEALMDTVTALSGSGPAYFFLIMQALQLGAEKLGLPSDIARILTIETTLGAAKMALESDLSLKELMRQVTSPGGTTEKAISVLEENNQLYNLLLKALEAAKQRSEELSRASR